jgi:fatty acyl-CoA reductase
LTIRIPLKASKSSFLINRRVDIIILSIIILGTNQAVSCRFNEDLKNAVILNTLGTKQVLQLCEKMKNLKSFVHVSTAYSNSDKHTVEEMVYEPPHDPNAVINTVEILPKEGIDILSKTLLVSQINLFV